MAREFDDAAFKRWFDHKRMVEDLLRGFAPATVARTLDFTTLEQLPADYVDDDLARGQGDAAWRVRFRDASDEWLYLLLLLEFQSTVDRRMAARILAYTARMYLKLIRGGELPSDGRLPPVLPVVIYNGERRWSAATEMLAAIAPVGEDLAPFQPRRRSTNTRIASRICRRTIRFRRRLRWSRVRFRRWRRCCGACRRCCPGKNMRVCAARSPI